MLAMAAECPADAGHSAAIYSQDIPKLRALDVGKYLFNCENTISAANSSS
jgi:hypothetical protein